MFTTLTNFRDFGGYRTENGKNVKSGMLYRSDTLCNLTKEEQRILSEKYRIKLIIDFRSESERLAEPDREIKGAGNIAISPKAKLAEIASEKLEKKSQKRKTSFEQIQDGEFTRFFDMETQMTNLMKSFVTDEENRTAFSDMLHQYLNEDNYPILQHCRGGKDRTGYGVSLLLGILEVPRKTIFSDYLLSNKFNSQEIEWKMEQYQKITEDERLLDNLRSMLEVREVYLETAFKAMDEYFGGFDQFVIDGLNFSKEKQELLKDLLLV
ncbi:hypothetical protein GIX45_23940 [Erwinia sp. CPCC 100877]|nr:hypothetical protein [Erwinia sp. CPCC 100877]